MRNEVGIDIAQAFLQYSKGFQYDFDALNAL